MGALRLILQSNDSAYGRTKDGTDFEIANMNGELCVIFSRTAQAESAQANPETHPLPRFGNVYKFNELSIEPDKQQANGAIKLYTTGTPVLKSDLYMHHEDAETTQDDFYIQDNIYIAIQEYLLDGDYSKETKDKFLNDLKALLEDLEGEYPEENLPTNKVIDLLRNNRGISALIETEQLIEKLDDIEESPSVIVPALP